MLVRKALPTDARIGHGFKTLEKAEVVIKAAEEQPLLYQAVVISQALRPQEEAVTILRK